MKFRIYPEAAGILAGLVFVLVAVVRFGVLVWYGEMTVLFGICYTASVPVLFLIVWDFFVYVAAWLQLDSEQFQRFRRSRESLLGLYYNLTGKSDSSRDAAVTHT